MAEPAGSPREPEALPEGVHRSPGWREVLILAFVVVAVVMGLVVLTGVLGTGAQDIVFRTPLAIVVMVVGTVGLLLWIARRPPPRV